MREMTVHIWGFVRDGQWEPPNGASATPETPAEVHNRVVSNIQHFGGDITGLVSTWGEAGWLAGTKFETPERDDGRSRSSGNMWHLIQAAQEAWPAKPARTEETAE